MAAGSSAPELFTSLVAVTKESSVGVGTIVGQVQNSGGPLQIPKTLDTSVFVGLVVICRKSGPHAALTGDHLVNQLKDPISEETMGAP